MCIAVKRGVNRWRVYEKKAIKQHILLPYPLLLLLFKIAEKYEELVEKECKEYEK